MSNADWKPDPTGRHQLRYFDGSNWTDHVADQGTQSTDSFVQSPSEAPASVVTASMQPTSQVILWEGSREDFGSAATKGRMVGAKYRITEDALVFEAGIVSTKEETVPLWAVMDVDLKQSMTQKMREVADLVVRLDPAGAKYGQTVVTIQSIRNPREVRDILSSRANVMRHAMLDHHHARDVEKRRAGATNISVGDASQPADSGGPAAPQPAIEESSNKGPAGPRGDVDADKIIDQIQRLGELQQAGVLTEEEFESKKAELLRRL